MSLRKIFCVLQLIVSFALLGFLFHMASLQEPFLFFIFDSQVYVDDFGGVEETKEKALESFHSLGNLLVELGLEEGVDKAQGDKGTLAKSGLARDVQLHFGIADVCHNRHNRWWYTFFKLVYLLA